MYMQGLHYNLDSYFPKNPDFLKEEEVCLEDYEQIKRLYPLQMRLAAVVLSECLDRYEYEGSPIFHEYPDAVTVYGIAKKVYDAMGYGDNNENKQQLMDMIQIMVCHDIYVRRRRHDRLVGKWR